MSKSTIKLLGTFGGKVNNKKFFGFDPLTLIFDGLQIDESSTLDASNAVQFEYPAQLSFSQNVKGWTPDKQLEVYEIDGAQAPVVPLIVGPDAFVEESFEVYERMSFPDIFAEIDSISPVRRSRRVSLNPLP